MKIRRLISLLIAVMMIIAAPLTALAGESMIKENSALRSLVSPVQTAINSGTLQTRATTKIGTGLYKVDGKWKYFENGKFKAVTGLVKKPADKGWYYVEKGIFTKKTGIVKKVKNDGKWYYVRSGGFDRKYKGLARKVNDDGYWYYVERGAFTKLTGIAERNGKYFYVIRGALDFRVSTGVTYGGSDWMVVKGGATKVKTASDKTFFRALQLMAKITNVGMSKEQKLKVCFDYVKKSYREYNPRIPHYKGMDWPSLYADDMLVGGGGNCFSYAAVFAYLAKACGYEKVYACHSGGHGWAEVDGLIYDPEWSKHRSNSTFYGIKYGADVGVDYKGAIAAGAPWMHVKI